MLKGGNREEITKRAFTGFAAILVIMGISLLFPVSSFAATMPAFERLQPVTTNLNAPTAVALDANECIFVTESSNNILHIFTQGGEYIESINGLNKPVSVAVDADGRIYVGNKTSGNVEVYDADLNLLLKLGDGDGEFGQPSAIAVSDSGRIYVADSRDDQVKVYISGGTLYATIGSTGSGDGEFNFPTGVAIDESAGELIVVDRQMSTDFYGDQVQGARVQIFDMDGTFKRSFGVFGVGEGLMQKPVGVATDGTGHIYVADAMQHVVHVFDGSDGASLGTIHDVDDPMRTPLHVVYAGSNRLFVTSLKTGKLEIFGLDGYTNMQTSPLSLTFEGETGRSDPTAQDVVITNNGSQPLEWTATADTDWITLSAASGSTAASGSYTLSVGISLSGLPVGIHTGYVTISSGASAADTVTVTLAVSESTLASADAGGPYSAAEGDIVVLDGSGSTGSISLYEWDVDNDGTYDYSSAGATQTHTYTANGSYTVKLRVTDADAGNTAVDTATAEISDTSPTAGFIASTTGGSRPLVVTFANTSTGYDQSLTYEWDFDADGEVDSTDEDPTYTYVTTKAYDVSLTVTDSDGSTDTLTVTNYIKVNSGLDGCYVSPVKRGVALYSYIQNAYDATIDGETIELQRMEMYADSLNLSRNVSVTMKGGYNCDYTGKSGATTINGTVTISTGTVVLEDIIIQ